MHALATHTTTPHGQLLQHLAKQCRMPTWPCETPDMQAQHPRLVAATCCRSRCRRQPTWTSAGPPQRDERAFKLFRLV